MGISSKTVRAIFEDALDLEDARQRPAFLDRVCGADGPMRREVEELLNSHDAAGGFLNKGASAETGLLGADDGLDEQLGRYKLLRKIGEGGWGVVYLAEQNEPVKRQVALKVIRLGMDTRKIMARFEAERQALAMMSILILPRCSTRAPRQRDGHIL